jgi:hypothetical protein
VRCRHPQVTDAFSQGKEEALPTAAVHEDDSEAHQIFRAAAGHKSKNAMPAMTNPVRTSHHTHALLDR